MAQGDIVGCIKARGSDSLGRWSWVRLVDKNQKLITVISAYQVCSRPTHHSGTTAYHQQESLLRQKRIKKAKPRKYFQRDLSEFVWLCKTRHESIVLVGDFNEPMHEHSSMTKLALTHGLVGILFQRNSHLPEPNTYVRGSKRINYALLSSDLVPAIQSCGYEPFQKMFKSDHRGMFLDFNTSMLFRNETLKMAPAAFRDFNSKSPSNNSKYITAKHNYLTQQEFFRHLTCLQSMPNGDPALAERLDKNLLNASESAGKKLKRYPKPWWSLTITKLRSTVKILQQQMSGFKTYIDVRNVLLSCITELELDLTLPLTQPACQELLATRRLALRAMEKESLTIRYDELAAKASLAADSVKPQLRQRLTKIRTSEAHAAMYPKIKAIRGKHNTSGFTSIEVSLSWPQAHSITTDLVLLDPKQATKWKTVDLPDEIVYYLLLQNRLHFGQAHGTPFTLPLFTNRLEWKASTETAELILTGDYTNSELSDIQLLLLQHCQNQHLDALPMLVTEAEFVSKFKIWNERTSTSPSGLHLGHYKALVSWNDADLDTEEGKLIEQQRKELIKAHVAMINYLLLQSHSYSRWKNVVNVMIKKEPGNSKIHRLRVIHLYEADYNFLLQEKWCGLISHAEERNLLHPGQYGSCPSQDALIPAFLEELKNEISYMSRKSLINFDNDAALCYDRIMPALASLIGRKLGLHQNVAFVQASTLEENKYKLKTSLGVSEEFYANCQAFPIYGTGQGSGNSPAIWCIVSSVLFSCPPNQGARRLFLLPRPRNVCLTVYDWLCGRFNRTSK